MTCRIKKAKKQQELDELAFGVLVSFKHHGATQFVDWYEVTKARRGERGLGHTTFSDVIKRLMGEGRVQRDRNGWYRVSFDVSELEPASIIPGNGTGNLSGNVVPDKATEAIEHLLSRKPSGVL